MPDFVYLPFLTGQLGSLVHLVDFDMVIYYLRSGLSTALISLLFRINTHLFDLVWVVFLLKSNLKLLFKLPLSNKHHFVFYYRGQKVSKIVRCPQYKDE